MRWSSCVLGVCLLASAALGQEEPPSRGLPLPDLLPRAAGRGQDADLAALARRWAPDIYQDVDDTQPEADLLTALDFDGDADMTNNWESLEGRSSAELLDQGRVYWWGSETETHVYLGYAFFHPRDWHDEGGLRRFGRKLIKKGTGEHENDLEGILLAISKETGEPELMVTQAHNDFWQYGDADLWAERGREDLDGPLLRDPETGRVQVFVEAKGHGVYGSPSKTDFDADGGDGVLYSAGGSSPPARDGLTVTDYGLSSLTPWYERFQRVPPGGADETFTRAGDRPAFRGDTRDEDAANPPWAWVDSDYPAAVSRWFWSEPARFVSWMFQPERPLSRRVTQRSWEPGQPGARRGAGGEARPRPPRATCGVTGRLLRLR